MSRSLRFFLIVSVLSIMGAIYIARSSTEIGNFNFPQRTDTGLQLPAAQSGENRKVIAYQPDKRTPRVTVVELTNGNTVYTYHRADGSKEKTEEFFAPQDSALQLRARANFAADGKTYTSDALFRKDNSKEREGVRLEDGSYDITYYHPDGVKVHKHQVVSTDRKPLLEEVFTDTGTLVSRAVLNPGGSFELTRFNDRGKRSSVSVKTNSSHEELTLFRQDGETVESRIINETYSTQVTSFLPDGRVEQVRLFTYEGMDVVVYRNGLPHHKQKWALRNPAEKDASKLEYRLEEVALVNASGKKTQVIELADDQRTPRRVITPVNVDEFYGLRKIKSFRPDGTVEKEVTRKGLYGDIESTTVFPAGTRHEVDQSILRPIPFQPPARPVPPPVPEDR